MKSGVAVALQIFQTTEAGIGHDGGTATRFIGGVGSASGSTALRGPVKTVFRIELMSQLMRHEIDVKRIADRIADTGNTACLTAGFTDATQTRKTTETSAEHVPDIVI